MSYYSKYDFVSPEPIYAIIKEELKSYMDTGMIDDLLFPTYLNKALQKLGKTTYTIIEGMVEVKDFEASLPDNFYAVREAWMCVTQQLTPYQSANSTYLQESLIEVTPRKYKGDCHVEENCDCEDISPSCPEDNCDECSNIAEEAVYKTSSIYNRSFQKMYLLKPGNISAKQQCDVSYTNSWEHNKQQNPGGSVYDSFDIRDGKFITNFRNGFVHLLLYITDYDDLGNQMVPDNFRVKEYIEAFLKYKMFETLSNQVTDETFNQIQQKLIYYKQLYDEALVMANIEIKKQDVWTKQRRIKNDLNRLNMYKLSFTTNRFGRRNN
jgi:hypothetical protein